MKNRKLSKKLFFCKKSFVQFWKNVYVNVSPVDFRWILFWYMGEGHPRKTTSHANAEPPKTSGHPRKTASGGFLQSDGHPPKRTPTTHSFSTGLTLTYWLHNLIFLTISIFFENFDFFGKFRKKLKISIYLQLSIFCENLNIL